EIRRELRGDDEIDRAPVRLVEIQESPEEGLRQNAGARIPLEGHGHELRLVATSAKLLDEPVGEDLRSSPGEGDLRTEDGDPHVRSARSASTSARRRSTCSWRSSTRRSAAAL